MKGDDALDAAKILNSERACTFRKTAEAFHLIDADTCTVYVPNEGNTEDIAQLRAGAVQQGADSPVGAKRRERISA